jgi:hypothetical protein
MTLVLSAIAAVCVACAPAPGPVPPDAGPDVTDAGPTPGPQAIAVQLNDVSLLFPLPTTDDALAHDTLHASDVGAHGALLPEALYDAVGHVAGSSGNPPIGGVGDAAYGDLRVVAVRLDPCFAALAPDPHGVDCKAQLRVVLQQVRNEGGVGGSVAAFDSALHVFYRLTRAELLDVTRQIVALRQANTEGFVAVDLGPLAPHPLMVAQGLHGAFASGVRALVLAHAGADNLTRITELSASSPGFAWSFKGFDVTSAVPPVVVPMGIPTIPGLTATFEQTFFSGFGADLEGQFNPATSDADNFTSLASVTTSQGLSEADRLHAFDALVHVEHPARHSPDTIDCASCHLATPVSFKVMQPKFALAESSRPDAFVPDARFVNVAHTHATYDVTASFNVHAFSYVDTSPGINQRTINETAAIVAYLNTLPDAAP